MARQAPTAGSRARRFIERGEKIDKCARPALARHQGAGQPCGAVARCVTTCMTGHDLSHAQPSLLCVRGVRGCATLRWVRPAGEQLSGGVRRNRSAAAVVLPTVGGSPC